MKQGRPLKFATCLLLAFITGCAEPTESGRDPGTQYQQNGMAVFSSPFGYCVEGEGCETVSGTFDMESFLVANSSGNASVEVIFENALPPTLEWQVWVVLRNGGLWGEGVGTTHVEFDLFDLIPGEYDVFVVPARTNTYAGPMSVEARWQVSYTTTG